MTGEEVLDYMLATGFRTLDYEQLMFSTTHHYDTHQVEESFVALDNKSLLYSERFYTKEAVDEFIQEIKEEHEQLIDLRDRLIAHAKEADSTSYYDRKRNSLIMFDKSWNFYVKKRRDEYHGRLSLNTSTMHKKKTIEELEKTMFNRLKKQIEKERPSKDWEPTDKNILGCFFSELKGYDARRRKFPSGVKTKLSENDIVKKIANQIATLEYTPLEQTEAKKFLPADEIIEAATKVSDFIYVKTEKNEYLFQDKKTG